VRPVDGVVDEVSEFLASVLVTNIENPLQYWKEMRVKWPKLAFVARRVLCIPAASAKSESNFSVLQNKIGHLSTASSGPLLNDQMILRSQYSAMKGRVDEMVAVIEERVVGSEEGGE
jgi:hypothetical protein